ncbi:MAG: 1-deoxy-D-xylulose-5-phosphate synthase [Gemmatimonadota bacterium]|nr:MAG: 1-deoxy-D-xylulose-5-phosphate synthase [Gemmatimonadota bacterium]
MLKTVNSPKDIKRLSIPELVKLAGEIRNVIISVVSKNGGHLAPSLGTVELTLALHYVFNAPQDKIIWDVGHQTYTHKIITGRRKEFETLGQYQGLAKFPKKNESPYDPYGTGHASTSISSALGMVCARDIGGEIYSVIAVVGDGALSGGLAFEGLNNAGELGKNIIVILNDNEMSISKNVGALSKYMTDLISAPLYNRLKSDIWQLTGKLSKVGKRIQTLVHRIDEGLKGIIVPGMLFEELGFRYFGPIDGHNLTQLIRTLKQIRTLSGPIFVHVLTKKGKGYKYAEEDAPRFHGVSPFERMTGTVQTKGTVPTYTEIFGRTLVRLGEEDPRIVGITAAMSEGTGMNRFAKRFPRRFFDVGIAEQHAVTFAAGLAARGYRPVTAIYSTFLQRAYDQVVHDVALQKLPVVFALDRAGIVGEDGPTHHGTFDLSYLRHVPNLIIMAPKDENELQHMMKTALAYEDGPIVLRYPRGRGVGVVLDLSFRTLPIGESEVVEEGRDAVFLAIGSMVAPALEAAQELKKEGYSVGVVNMRFVKPLDRACVDHVCRKTDTVFTLEENVLTGGFGTAVLEYVLEAGYSKVSLKRLGLPDAFIDHGGRSELLHMLKLDPEGIAQAVKQELQR